MPEIPSTVKLVCLVVFVGTVVLAGVGVGATGAQPVREATGTSPSVSSAVTSSTAAESPTDTTAATRTETRVGKSEQNEGSPMSDHKENENTTPDKLSALVTDFRQAGSSIGDIPGLPSSLFGAIGPLLIGGFFGASGSYLYSRWRGQVAQIHRHLSATNWNRNTKSPDDLLLSKGTTKMAKDIAEPFTDGGIGRKVINQTHQQSVDSTTTAETPAQKLDEIRDSNWSSKSQQANQKGRTESEVAPSQEQGTSGNTSQSGQSEDASTKPRGESRVIDACESVRDMEGTSSNQVVQLLDNLENGNSKNLEYELKKSVRILESVARLNDALPHGDLQKVDNQLAKKILRRCKEKEKKINQLEDSFEAVAEELDTRWLRDQIQTRDRPATEWLPDAAHEGLLEPAVVSAVARTADPRGTVSGTRLVESLRDPHQTDVESVLTETIENLKRHDQLTQSLRQGNDKEIEEKLRSLRERVEDNPLPLSGLERTIEECKEELQRATAENSLKRHSLLEGLDRVDRSIDRITDSGLGSSEWDAVASDVTQLAEEADAFRQPGKNQIKKGHLITGVFVETAEVLTQRARHAAENGEMDRARALVEGAEQIYEAIKKVYKTKETRRLLQ